MNVDQNSADIAWEQTDPTPLFNRLSSGACYNVSRTVTPTDKSGQATALPDEQQLKAYSLTKENIARTNWPKGAPAAVLIIFREKPENLQTAARVQAIFEAYTFYINASCVVYRYAFSR